MNKFVLLEKIIYIAVAFAAIVFFYLLFKAWSEENFRYFLLSGDLQSAGVVILIIFAIGFVFKFLWKWEIREIFRPKNKIQRNGKWNTRR